MSDKHKTIADIVAEKRRRAAAIRADLSTVPVRRDDQLAEAEEQARLDHYEEIGDAERRGEAPWVGGRHGTDKAADADLCPRQRHKLDMCPDFFSGRTA